MACVATFAIDEYNRLGSVEDQSADLHRHPLGIESIVTRLGNVVRVFNYVDHVGISLLHRHYTLKKGESMVHELTADQDVCKPTAYSAAELVPSLLGVAFDKETGRFMWLPLEFVRRSNAVQHSDLVLADDAFLQEFGLVLQRHNLLHLLGVSLADFTTPLPDGKLYVESNDPASRTSTVVLTNEVDIDMKSVLDTLWSCKGPRQQSCARIQVCQRIGSAHAYVFVHKKY